MAVQMGVMSDDGPGAGFFPLVAGVGLAILSAAWFLRKCISRERRTAEATDLIGVGLQVLALVVFTLLLPVIGFTPAAAALVFATALLVGERRPVVLILLAIALSLGVRALFGLLGATF